MTTSPILEKKTKSYTHITIIHVKYIWEFFWEFSHDPFSWSHVRSVKTNKFIVD